MLLHLPPRAPRSGARVAPALWWGLAGTSTANAFSVKAFAVSPTPASLLATIRAAHPDLPVELLLRLDPEALADDGTRAAVRRLPWNRLYSATPGDPGAAPDAPLLQAAIETALAAGPSPTG